MRPCAHRIPFSGNFQQLRRVTLNPATARLMEQEHSYFPSPASSFHVVGDWREASQAPLFFFISVSLR